MNADAVISAAWMPLVAAGSVGAATMSAAAAVIENAGGANGVVTEHWMNEEELKELIKEFEAHAEKLDRRLTEDEEVRNFQVFFGAMRDALGEVGRFSEDMMDDEADFISKSQADAARVMRVLTRVPVTREIASAVLAACEALGSEHAVLFYGKEGRAVVFSNGDFCHEE